MMTAIADVSSFIVDVGLKLGADEIAAMTVRDVSKQVRFANNEVTVTQTWDETSAGVFLKKDRRALVASVTDLSKESLRKALGDLLHMAMVVKPHESYAPLPEGPFEYQPIQGLYDKRVFQLGDEWVDYVEAAINSALTSGGKRTAGTLLTKATEYSLVTSKNVEAKHKKTEVNLVVRCLANGESSGMGVTCGTNLGDLNPEEAGEEAGRLAKMSLNPVAGKSGRYDVVFSRIASAVIFDILAGMSSAFYVDYGRSSLVDRLGERIASENLSIYDDARVEGGMGSTPFDDEGYPTGKTSIIEKGVLRSYLHNSFTAKRYRTRSTANAGWIDPHAWNIIVEGSEPSEDELLGEVKAGLYVNNITYARFQDYRQGDFSAVVRDGVFTIENGEITKAVKGLRLSENLIHILKNITALSRNAKQISHWWMEWDTPSVKTPLLNVQNIGFTVPTK
jgi:PmbA protein